MRSFLAGLFAIVSITVFAQGVDYLGHNNTNVTLPRSGNFFYTPGGGPGFEVPVNSGDHMINSMQFYFMGKDVNGTLHASIGGPSQMGQDVFDGPYSSLGNYGSNYQAAWQDRSWQICQEEIDIYKNWWEACQGPNQNPNDCVTAQVPSNETLMRIYNWRAHGNTANGEDYYMAPFWDYNMDGAYDPSEGDYPLIKGCCATWRVDNDAADIHTMSGADPLGIEMRYMTYQYRNFGLLNDVTFVEVEIINRSNLTYPEFYYAINTDVTTPNFSNTYFGSDSSRSLFYAYYNNDVHPTLGMDPPVLGIVALEEPLTAVVDQVNGGSITEIWGEMQGLRFGQNAMTNLQGDTTQFIFNENPNIPNGWSEEQTSIWQTNNKVILATENGEFAPGDRITQTFAFVYMKNGTRLQSVDAMYLAADELHTFYDTIANAQCEEGVLSAISLDAPSGVTMMPNPASDYVDIILDEFGRFSVTVLDMNGKAIKMSEGEGVVTLHLSDLANGAYFVQVQSGSSVTTKKLILDH
ncbi:MAG: T9SS type A sorting domain-containing protein [bacterium]|nr:T9SS type A sorting domain-containing protein [bacterium]